MSSDTQAGGGRRKGGGGPSLRDIVRVASTRLLLGAAIAAAVATVILLGFRETRALVALEAQFNDRLRVILSPMSERQDPRITILTITEDTLALFPYRSPVDRDFLARLIRLLDEAGVTTIGLDILIDQATEPEKDQALVDAIRDFEGPLVLAWADARAGLRPAQDAFLAEFLERSGATAGAATLRYDDDGVVRDFEHSLDGTDVRSFSAALMEATDLAPPAEEGLIDWRRETGDGAGAFQTLPSHVLLTLPEAVVKARAPAWFGGRYVLIGADLEQTDRHQTSLAVDPTISNRTSAGVLVHAHILSQMLDGRVVRNWSVQGAPGVALTVLLAGLGVLLGISSLSFVVKLLGLALVGGGWVGLAVALSLTGGPILPVAPALLALGVAFGLGAAAEAFLSSREKSFIREAFSHYLEPAMVDRLARDRSSLKLGGERREISFIFTDVAGFTDMSERLAPEVLSALLNEYFDGIADIISRNEGSIDKFIGDAVVALFGALTDQPDHALDAVRCAAEMDAFAEAFRERKADLGLGVTRIGVHTGVASVGNFGGRRRFDYTAMGDAMNTAARLESINKRLGTRVTVSAAARAAALANERPDKPLPELRPVGRVALKGKAEPVEVWNLDRETPAAQRAAYAEAFAALAGGVEAARAAFGSLAAAGTPDPLVTLHLERLRAGEHGDVIT